MPQIYWTPAKLNALYNMVRDRGALTPQDGQLFIDMSTARLAEALCEQWNRDIKDAEKRTLGSIRAVLHKLKELGIVESGAPRAGGLYVNTRIKIT